MSAIGRAFAQARRSDGEKRAALVCYAMGGDASLAETEQLLLALDAAGADVLELGVPFSDPIADGPVLQAAALRALAAGTTLRKLLAMTARLKGRLRAPVVLMGYANPFFRFGFAEFAAAAAESGIAGAIVPDLPLEETGPRARRSRPAASSWCCSARRPPALRGWRRSPRPRADSSTR